MKRGGESDGMSLELEINEIAPSLPHLLISATKRWQKIKSFKKKVIKHHGKTCLCQYLFRGQCAFIRHTMPAFPLSVKFWFQYQTITCCHSTQHVKRFLLEEFDRGNFFFFLIKKTFFSFFQALADEILGFFLGSFFFPPSFSYQLARPFSRSVRLPRMPAVSLPTVRLSVSLRSNQPTVWFMSTRRKTAES